MWWTDPVSRPIWAADSLVFYSFVLDLSPSWLLRFDVAGGANTPDENIAVDQFVTPDLLLSLAPSEVRVFADVDIPFLNAPRDDANVQALLTGGERITAMLGRNSTGDWLAIRLEGDRDGWVRASEMSYSGNITALTILEQ